ncbi:hypothetical protein HDV00_009477 [Rhizophlyctis rosea]|nr:hypothetical protein HDV00_009477 [Rhizophlyctis rosea]
MPLKEIPFTVPFGGTTKALLTLPATQKGEKSTSQPPSFPIAVLLTHGASGDHTTADLTHTANHLANAGYPVIRFTAKTTNIVHRTKTFSAVLDYVDRWLGVDADNDEQGGADEDSGDSDATETDEPKVAKPKTSSKPEATDEDDDEQDSPETPPAPCRITQGYILSGRSMGARAAIHTAVASLKSESFIHTSISRILGILLISYPLHTPGDKNKLRDEPLLEFSAKSSSASSAPILFISGSKDNMCDMKLHAVVMGKMKKGVGERVAMVKVPGGTHGLSVGKVKKDVVLNRIGDCIVRWIKGPVLNSEGAHHVKELKQPSQPPEEDLYQNDWQYFICPSASHPKPVLQPPPSSNPPKPVAIITLISSDAYVPLATILRHSIRLQNTTAHIIAAYIPTLLSPQSLCTLRQSGWDTRPVDLIPLPHNATPEQSHIRNPAFRDLFTKLRIWTWTEYAQILLVDADTLVLGSLEDLWKWPLDFAAVSDSWEDRLDVMFNAGVLYFRPDVAVFEDMMRVREKDIEYYRLESAEQAFLNCYWGFSSHRLPFKYNLNLAMKHHRKAHGAAWKLVWNQRAIIHYTMTKPHWNDRPKDEHDGDWAPELLEWFKVQDSYDEWRKVNVKDGECI